MVTIAEVAETLKIPASTGREYVKRFRPFFSTKKVAGSRFPKYPDVALEIMQDIVDGYRKQLSTDDIFDLLQQKYPIDVELLERQQRHAQNVLNSNNDVIITASTTSQTSLDMYVKMQETQFQVLQQMTKVIENNNKLMERLISLLEKKQTPQSKHVQKPAKQPKKINTEKVKKKGLFSFFRGK